MHLNDFDTEAKIRKTGRKTKVLAILGCSGTIILGILVILLSAWILLLYMTEPKETHIMTSQSPNEKNRIEFFRVEEFPDPTLKIRYDNRYIIKMNILPSSDKISVEWENNKEANIILDGNGKEPDVEEVRFK